MLPWSRQWILLNFLFCIAHTHTYTLTHTHIHTELKVSQKLQTQLKNDGTKIFNKRGERQKFVECEPHLRIGSKRERERRKGKGEQRETKREGTRAMARKFVANFCGEKGKSDNCVCSCRLCVWVYVYVCVSVTLCLCMCVLICSRRVALRHLSHNKFTVRI